MIATKNKSLLNQAINADYVFISVMGAHANESPKEIYKRKIGDIKKCKESLWLSRINEGFITECRRVWKGKVGYLILVNGNASNTESDTPATKFSEDKTIWKDIDANLTPVTGKLNKKGTPAYCIDDIVLCQDPIDLNYYEDTIRLGAIKFSRGYSNVFARSNATPLPGGMKDHKREIVAVLRLKAPYVVWVK